MFCQNMIFFNALHRLKPGLTRVRVFPVTKQGHSKSVQSFKSFLSNRYWYYAGHRLSTKASKQKSSRVFVDSTVTIGELARHAGVPPEEILRLARDAGEKIDRGDKTILRPDTVELLLSEYGLSVSYHVQVYDVSRRPLCTDESVLKPRAPVVTIMGHVDHGKTTLLDTLRKTSVAAAEAGGITQHIGAFSGPTKMADFFQLRTISGSASAVQLYRVKVASGSRITFIDTPGHAAFETMRARGAHVTDVVVLVVAADDGVMPQTVESLNHANNANVPVIVAINKIDKPKSNLSNVKNQLLGQGLQLEEFGGDVQTVEISALSGLNLDNLTEAIVAHAEVSDLRAEFDCLAEGIVLESRVEKGRGAVATVLVQRGILKKGSVVVAGTSSGKVRQMLSDSGKAITNAIPSMPVQVTGWKNLPEAGDQLLEVETESFAYKVAAYRRTKQDKMRWYGPSISDCSDDLQVMNKNFTPTYDDSDKLDIVVKADVNGSLEAILDALKTYKGQNPKLSVVSSGVGPVTENDIRIIKPFKGMLFCFNVGIPKDMQKLAEHLNIKIHSGKVIYHLLQALKEEMTAKLPPLREDVPVGEATILKVFRLTGKRKATVAGCRVNQGQLRKNETYQIHRKNDVIFEGNLSSMKRGDDDIDVVKNETECGLCFENFHDLQEGDKIECFSKTFKKQEVDWKWKF